VGLHGVAGQQLFPLLLALHHALQRGRVADALRDQRLLLVLRLARLGLLALLPRALRAAPASAPPLARTPAHLARETPSRGPHGVHNSGAKQETQFMPRRAPHQARRHQAHAAHVARAPS